MHLTYTSSANLYKNVHSMSKAFSAYYLKSQGFKCGTTSRQKIYILKAESFYCDRLPFALNTPLSLAPCGTSQRVPQNNRFDLLSYYYYLYLCLFRTHHKIGEILKLVSTKIPNMGPDDAQAVLYGTLKGGKIRWAERGSLVRGVTSVHNKWDYIAMD